MAFIKEESEDFRIEEVFSLKHEDTETQTGWFSFSKLNSLIFSVDVTLDYKVIRVIFLKLRFIHHLKDE